MQRSQAVSYPNRTARLLFLGGALLLVPAANAAVGATGADDGAVVTGVVRDAQGVAQMGALVQVLAANSAAIGTAYTDLQGRYVIPHLHPGRYLVRASATLYLPATRANLRLNSGASAVVNLTLAGLFDAATWLPAQRHRADDGDDDWKWTLRSPASRPILRIVDDGTTIEVSDGDVLKVPATVVRASVFAGDGGYGEGGVHSVVAIYRALPQAGSTGSGDAGGEMTLRANLASSSAGPASSQFDAGYEVRNRFGGATRTVVSYQAHPGFVAAGAASGLEVLEMTSGQGMRFGDAVDLEAGGRLEAIRTAETGVASRPFLRVAVQPTGSWRVEYRMATDRDVQGLEDVSGGQAEVPVALVRDGKLSLESGRHQEGSLARKVGRGTIAVAYYHDAMERTTLSGGGAMLPSGSIASAVGTGMLIDPETGTFRALGGGYRTNGMRMTVAAPVAMGFWITAEYSSGQGMASETGQAANYEQALNGMHARTSQAATLALKGTLAATGTRVRASYRWQPSSLVTAVDPYSALAEQPFLSCQIRQPIRIGHGKRPGWDATIDVTNLLAEGYRPFLSADGQTLYFAQAPRSIQAGLSFTF